jgi:small subunit ribosomal protein S20
MPNHKSAEKRVRQSERRRKINRHNRAKLRTSIKNLNLVMSGNSNRPNGGMIGRSPSDLLPLTVSEIDKAVQKGVLHRNAAARHKARLTARVNATAK